MKTGQQQLDVAQGRSWFRVSRSWEGVRNFTGNYYRILGWIDLVASIAVLASVYWTGRMSITFAFVFWFWLGSSLERGRPAARRWAIVIPVAFGLIVVAAALFPSLDIKLAPWGYGVTDPAFIPFASALMILFTVPAVVLLGRRGRAAFPANSMGEQAGDGDAPQRPC